MTKVQQHAIRKNETTRLPRSFLYLDTEAKIHKGLDSERQTWRLAVTCYDHWSVDKGDWSQPDWQQWLSASDMWAYVTAKAKPNSRLVVVGHNIGYDVRIANVFGTLPSLGWSLEKLGLHDKSMTMTWRNAKKATLVFADSYSWLPMSLQRIGEMLGHVKQPLPWDGTDDELFAYCRNDVEILREAFQQLLSFIEEGDLGNWQRTGASMAWANWRHRHYTHKVVCHHYDAVTKAEEAAMYTGRCEAWYHGRLVSAPFTEWDLPLAYTNVAESVNVPTCLANHHWRIKPDVFANPKRDRRWLVRATVQQDYPVLPMHDDTGYVWPVGTVEGWYWDVELATAMLTGATVAVHEAWSYFAHPALKQWAQWVLSVLANQRHAWTPIEQAAVKHWARALIGKFAAKYTEWAPLGTGLGGAVGTQPLYDRDSGVSSDVLMLGNQSYISTGEQFVNDAVPAIQGVVMAEARCRLWALMCIAGLDHVVYVDTDSLITDNIGTANLQRELKSSPLWGIRPKRTCTSLTINGPRQLVINGEFRYAGIPSAATYLPSGEIQGQVWEGVVQALRMGRPDTVVITAQSYRLHGVDNRRWHQPGGTTLPYRVDDQGRCVRGDPRAVSGAVGT